MSNQEFKEKFSEKMKELHALCNSANKNLIHVNVLIEERDAVVDTPVMESCGMQLHEN